MAGRIYPLFVLQDPRRNHYDPIFRAFGFKYGNLMPVLLLYPFIQGFTTVFKTVYKNFIMKPSCQTKISINLHCPSKGSVVMYPIIPVEVKFADSIFLMI